MKKILSIVVIALMTPFMTMNSQTYSSLWKQVREAQQNDLPQTEQQVLGQIVAKAEAENAYGQLIKAELQQAKALSTVAPDSLEPAVERLKQRLEQTADAVRRAIYCTVLGAVYEENRQLDIDNYRQVASDYYDRAMEQPAALAAVKAGNYEPFVVSGADSRLFGDDMLSIVGYETRHYGVLHDYYTKAGNRRAALLTGIEKLRQEAPDEVQPLRKSAHLQRIDSLIAAYEDLPECGEAAIARYEFMDERTDATVEQKWQYINYAIDHWPSWQRMNELRNRQRDLTTHTFSAEFGQLSISNREQSVKLTRLRGISQLTMRVYSTQLKGDTDLNPANTDDYKKIKPQLTLLSHMTQMRTYMGKKPYETFEDSVVLKGLPAGVYMVEMETTPQTQVSRQLYFVSDVRLLMLNLPGKQTRYVAVNAITGQPIKGATVKITTYQGYKKPDSVIKKTTDQKGELIYAYTGQRPSEVYAYTDDDQSCPPLDPYGRYSYYESQRKVFNVFAYTDRQIYRPGQTVHAAAVLYTTENGYQSRVEADKNTVIELHDANDKLLEKKEGRTDRFGTFATEFQLPQQTLSGQFYIIAHNIRHYFRVEEYKRPSFEVELPPVRQNYEDGDTVVARGTARTYAGVPVQGARVKYKVVRRLPFWWMNYSRYWGSVVIGQNNSDELMAEGETITGADGSFSIDVPMVLPKTKHTMFYNFVVTADVTDQAGETHQADLSLPLGNRPTALTATMPDKVLAEEDTKMAFHRQNAAGIDLDATVRYRFDNGRWQEQKTNTLFTIPSMKSGRHTLMAVCEEDSLEQEFVVFSLDDKRPATETDDWFWTSHEQFPYDGTPVTVQVGSSEKNVHILYSIFSGQRVIESGAVDRSNELLNRKFTYDESMDNGLLVSFAWVKDGKTYTHNATIKRPTPDKNLRLTWKTFRNRLLPGQQEEWILNIVTPDGSRPEGGAQLLATLYDKSLDQLVPQQWSIVPYESLPLPSTRWSCVDRGLGQLNGYRHQGLLSVNSLRLSHFDHDVYPCYFYRLRPRPLYRSMASRAQNMAVVEEDMMVVEKSSGMAYDVAPALMAKEAPIGAYDEEAATEESTDGGRQTSVQLRENLQETAFFYPQLTTDEEGNVTIKFTLPESLTTWRFLGVAHTEDMMYGNLSDEAVARKEVMIQPNMPRFVRQGDRATISARIFNTTDKALSGTARLQLLDPESEKVIAQSSENISVAPDSTVSATFVCQPREWWPSLLVARVSVSGKTFSDGEQHYLPVLPNRERVTLTVPFTQNEPGTKTIDLTKLFPKDSDGSSDRSQVSSRLSPMSSQLTVEYTNNPAWLLIQALPAIGHPHDNCAVCQATSLYANAIGMHILGQNPSAKHVFEAWKHETTDVTTLNSQLEKNQELKSLLLDQTPWLLDAKDENAQRHMLADFFDDNLMQQRLQSAVDNLTRLQNADGSWSWWPGMDGSTWMTIELTEMLVRLDEMTGIISESSTSNSNSSPLSTCCSPLTTQLDKAFGFIGKEMVKLVDEMKRQEKKGVKPSFPSFKALQWLYIVAIDGRQLPDKVQEANTYLKNLLKKETRNQTIMEKAMSAIILNNQTYIRSLKEYTVYKEEMGRYYDTPRASYSWRDYRIPTQVAAIEALKRLTPGDTQTIEEMQRWLLQEKRTQAWDTPTNSVDAIYAFLNGRSQALAPQEKTVLRIDGKPLDTSDATAGLGYVKHTMPATDHKTFTAEKTSTGTSWGAVYAQFMQNTADISDQKSGISVKRELLVNGKGAQPSPVTSQLSVGDRVKVRITIEADRDYDFVQVIDKRAACLEPVDQLSGYRRGYYITPRDCTTNYYINVLSKGKHIIETEYYVDRAGSYETGTCTVECAYSPEFRGLNKSMNITVSEKK